MAKKLTAEQHWARMLAYREAADHLLMSWTDDQVEYQEGEKVSKQLHRAADYHAERAATMEAKARQQNSSPLTEQ
jgi:hypothetical protein